MYGVGLNSVFIGNGRIEELSRIIVKSQGQCDRLGVTRFGGALEMF